MTWQSFLTVAFVQLAMMIAFDCLRRWRLRARDLMRFMLAFGSAVAIMMLFRIVFRSEAQVHIRPPFTVNLINGVLWGAGALVIRWLWTLSRTPGTARPSC